MHRLPIAGRLRALLSFHYFKRTDVANLAERLTVHGAPPDIFADSGAFSAWTQGAEITVDEYAAWLHMWHDYLTVYCNLDVINDPAGSERNQRALEAHGLQPLPVWHVRSDRAVFAPLCEEYRYVALGGMVGTPWKKLMPTLVWAMQEAQRYGTVLHGLGLTSNEPLKQLPFYSVDSSSWGSGYRYGQVRVYTDQRYVSVKLGDVKAWRKYGPVVKRLGFEPSRFANGEAQRDEIAALSAVSTMIYETAIRRRLGLVPLADDDRKPYVRNDTTEGLLQFLAEGSADNLEKAAGGLRQYLSTGNAVDAFHDASAGLRNYLSPGGAYKDLHSAADGVKVYLAGAVEGDVVKLADHLDQTTTPEES
jgi:hypothetical protein